MGKGLRPLNPRVGKGLRPLNPLVWGENPIGKPHGGTPLRISSFALLFLKVKYNA